MVKGLFAIALGTIPSSLALAGSVNALLMTGLLGSVVSYPDPDGRPMHSRCFVQGDSKVVCVSGSIGKLVGGTVAGADTSSSRDGYRGYGYGYGYGGLSSDPSIGRNLAVDFETNSSYVSLKDPGAMNTYRNIADSGSVTWNVIAQSGEVMLYAADTSSSLTEIELKDYYQDALIIADEHGLTDPSITEWDNPVTALLSGGETDPSLNTNTTTSGANYRNPDMMKFGFTAAVALSGLFLF